MAIAGKLYVAAGRTTQRGFRNLNVLEIYDPATDTWRREAPAPTARSGVAMAAWNGVLYLFGGEAPDRIFDQTEAYNPATDAWTTPAPMPTGRHGMGAAVLAGAIFVVGGGPEPGFSFSSVNQRFTPP